MDYKRAYNPLIHDFLKQNLQSLFNSARNKPNGFKSSKKLIAKAQKRKEKQIRVLKFAQYVCLIFAILSTFLPKKYLPLLNEPERVAILIGCISIFVLGSLALTLIQQPLSELAKIGPGFSTYIFKFKGSWETGIYSALAIIGTLVVAVESSFASLTPSFLLITVALFIRYWMLSLQILQLSDSLTISEMIKSAQEEEYEQIIELGSQLALNIETDNTSIIHEQLNWVLFPKLRSNIDSAANAVRLGKITEATYIWRAASQVLNKICKEQAGDFGLNELYLPDLLFRLEGLIEHLVKSRNYQIVSIILEDIAKLTEIYETSDVASYTRLNVSHFMVKQATNFDDSEWEHSTIALGGIRLVISNFVNTQAFEDVQRVDIQIGTVFESTLQKNQFLLADEFSKHLIRSIGFYARNDENLANFLLDNLLDTTANAIVFNSNNTQSIYPISKRFFPGYSIDQIGLMNIINGAESNVESRNLQTFIFKFTKQILNRIRFDINDDQSTKLRNLLIPIVAVSISIEVEVDDTSLGDSLLSDIIKSLKRYDRLISGRLLNDFQTTQLIWTYIVWELFNKETHEEFITTLHSYREIFLKLEMNLFVIDLLNVFDGLIYEDLNYRFKFADENTSKFLANGMLPVYDFNLGTLKQIQLEMNEWLINKSWCNL